MNDCKHALIVKQIDVSIDLLRDVSEEVLVKLVNQKVYVEICPEEVVLVYVDIAHFNDPEEGMNEKVCNFMSVVV